MGYDLIMNVNRPCSNQMTIGILMFDENPRAKSQILTFNPKTVAAKYVKLIKYVPETAVILSSNQKALLK